MGLHYLAKVKKAKFKKMFSGKVHAGKLITSVRIWDMLAFWGKVPPFSDHANQLSQPVTSFSRHL